MKEAVRKFWSDRAKTTDVPRPESQVNFLKDANTAEEYINAETEVINRELKIEKSDTLVDLGAGNGRWSFLLAPKLKKVIAVEYIKEFTKAMNEFILKQGINNIEVVNSSGEEFCRENIANICFVSGLLNYLDEEQYIKTIENITKTTKPGGVLFMRETISVLDNEFIVDKYSDELETYYWSNYRTSKQHIDILEKNGFKLHKYAPFFEDGSPLNKRLETRLHYFIFHKNK